MKPLIKWIGFLVACVALLYFGFKFKDQIQEAMPLLLESNNLIWCGVGALAVSIQMACAGLAWQRILVAMGISIPSLDAIRILFVSQFARYIPGNIGHHLGKLAMARAEGVSLKKGAISIFIETVLVLLIGLSISTIFLPRHFYDYLTQADWKLGVVVIIGVFLVGVVCVWRRNWLIQTLLEAKDALAQNWQSQLLRLFEVLIYYTINFLFLGWLAWLIVTQVFEVYSLSMLQLTSIMAFSWAVGFVAPGAPAGLGVREVIALSLLTGSYDPGVAAGIVMLHRLVLTLGDLITFGLGLLMTVIRGRKQRPTVGGEL
ncbi:MAG TPA: hypothetical protein DCX06_04535 [Opitutae bacterium]|nr:hypothetical protein [Opitutae bacterium]